MDKATPNTITGVANVSVANIGWGLTDTVIALLSLGLFTVWLHGLTGAAFLFVVLLIQKQKFVFREFLDTFFLGAQRAIVWAAVFVAFQEDNPTIAITILSFATVISIIVFSKFFHEKVTGSVLALAICGVIGVLLISIKDLDSFTLSRGAILSLLVLPFAATGPYLVRKIQVKVPAKKSATYMYVWIAVLLTPAFPFFPDNIHLGFREIIFFIILAITGAGGHVLYNLSQAQTSFITNIILSNLHTVATALFAYIILDRTLNLHQIFGVLLTLSVVLLVNFYHGRDKSLIEPLDI